MAPDSPWTPEKIANSLTSKFVHQPSECQKKAIYALGQFLCQPGALPAMVLRGYAGTGKTTLLGHLVEVLDEMGMPYCLMAPTGRAAKVLARYSGKQVKTIHSEIYIVQENLTGGIDYQYRDNKYMGTLFIIDEASMVGIDSRTNDLFEGASLLRDLVDYARQGAGNRLLFVGDRAQLPPVLEVESPALDEGALGKWVSSLTIATLETVHRQAKDSGILANATTIRQAIKSQSQNIPPLAITPYPDLEVLPKKEIVPRLLSLYRNGGQEETMIITHSNRRALHYNDLVRREIIHTEEEIIPGERLMVCRNSSHWKAEDGQQVFVANGEFIRVLRIANRREYEGFSFVDIDFTLETNPDEVIQATAMLDVLRSHSPSLSPKEWSAFFEKVKHQLIVQYGGKNLKDKLKSCPYLHALQLKYGYAITCHKAQGGQWSNVLLDLELYPRRLLDPMFLRWVYTAFTRAQQRLILISPPNHLIY